MVFYIGQQFRERDLRFYVEIKIQAQMEATAPDTGGTFLFRRCRYSTKTMDRNLPAVGGGI